MIKQAEAICKHHGFAVFLWPLTQAVKGSEKLCFYKPSPFSLTFPNRKDALCLTLQVSNVLPLASQMSGSGLIKTVFENPCLGACRAWVKGLVLAENCTEISMALIILYPF